MKKKLFLLVLLPIFLASNSALAKVVGPCANCHTMHNMQGGVAVESATSRSLTKGDCIGCHTGTNGDGKGIPYVNAGDTPLYGPDYDTDGALVNDAASVAGRTLAGGTFYYVSQAQHAKGHNVKGLGAGGAANPDTTIVLANTPPGWITTWGDSGIATNGDDPDNWGDNQLTCAGIYGCHGQHLQADDFADLKGAHHGDDSTIDGNTTVSSFRFLYGIIGKEDSDWEYTVSSLDHNQYSGVANITKAAVALEPVLGAAGKGEGISTFCGTCHGNFHTGSSGDLNTYDDGDTAIGTAPWLRHPTDYALVTAGGEYVSYAGIDTGAAVGTYNVIAPVASSSVASTISTTVITGGAATSIVTCLSCHRAHGSPYDDLLRWKYAGLNAGTTNVEGVKQGCFICHTTKD